MKHQRLIGAILCLLFFTHNVNAECLTVHQQLCELNKYWVGKNIENPILQEHKCFDDHEDLIQLHLQLVEQHLRQKDLSTLTLKQITKRNEGLDILSSYWKKKQFPKNTYHPGKVIPYFIDDFNTACAVGHIVRETGYGYFAEKVKEENNYAYIEDMNYPELVKWVDEYGFDEMELRWIQPTYGCWFWRSDILVTNTNASGFGSLSWAIDQANMDSGPNTIIFNLPPNSVIYLYESLWMQGECDAINGYSISDKVTLDGTNLDSDSWGIVLNSKDIDITNLIVRNFPNTAIGAWQAEGCSIQSNIFYGNKYSIVAANGSNQISIQNNIIGLDENMNHTSSTDDYGVLIEDANNISIINNHICGMSNVGIYLDHNDVGNSINILGNTLGLDINGSYSIPNHHGISVGEYKSDVNIFNNVVSGNEDTGIVIDGASNISIYDNVIGTDELGSYAISNDTTGIWIRDVTALSIEDNLISGNGWGIAVVENCNNITIQRNKIGTDINGNTAIPNNVGAALFRKITGNNVSIGGDVAEDANIIANHQEGLWVGLSNDPVLIKKNQIYCNSQYALAFYQNNYSATQTPTISSATTTSISGTSSTNAFIDLYQHDNTACSNLPCQGKTYIGSTQANNSGSWTYTGSIQQGSTITAIATKNNNSSEYADCVSVEQGGNCDTPPTIVQTLDKGHTYLKLQFEHVDDAQSYHLRWRKQGTSSWQYEMDLQEFAYVESSHHYPHYPSCYCSSTCIGLPAFSFPTIVDIRGIEPCTTYEFQIASVCLNGQTSSYSTYYENTEECNNSYFNSDNYCVGRFSDYARISQFKIGGIGYDYDNDHNPCEYCNGCQSPYEGYQFFSNREIVLTKGNSVGRNGNDDNGEACDSSNSPFELCIDGDGSDLEDWYFNIWIDYNGDGDFLDFNENVYNEFFGFDIYNFCQNLTECEYFTIPSNITVSNSRIRISLSQGSNINPNEAFNYGHVWDFPVRFEENVTIPSCNLSNDEILCLDWVEEQIDSNYPQCGAICIGGSSGFSVSTHTYQGETIIEMRTSCGDVTNTYYSCDGSLIYSCLFYSFSGGDCDQSFLNQLSNSTTIWDCSDGLPNCSGGVPCNLSLSIFSATDTSCGENNGNISAIPVGGTPPYQYNLGGGNQPSGTFSNLSAGFYTITITDSEGCTATDTANIFNDGVAPPEAYFTYTNNGLTVSFNTIIAPDPNTYSWSFGDGNISSAFDPIHTYSTSSTYNVCLTLSNTCGSDTYCEDITIIGDLPDCPSTVEEILCLDWVNNQITQLQLGVCDLDFVNIGIFNWENQTLIGIETSGIGGTSDVFYDCEGNIIASCTSGFIGNDCDSITEEFVFVEGLWSCNEEIPSCGSPWEVTGCTGFSAFSTHSVVLNRRDGFFAADIAGEELSSNDWIGIFYTDENGIEHCAGAKQYPAEEDIIVFDVCVNDSATPQKDGFELGEAFVFRVWQNGVENSDVKAEYYPEGVSILNTNIIPNAEELFNLSNKVSYLESIKRKVVIGDADCEDPIDITCELLSNMTNEGDASEVNFYCGSDNYVNGSEVYFSFDNDVVQDVKIKIDNMVEDLELYILNEDCNEDNCVALSENQETEKEIVLLTNLEIGTYHIAVDGYIGATSTFDIDIECGDFGGGSGGSNDDPIDPDDPSDPPTAECPKSISCNSSATCTTVGLSNNIYSYGCSPNRFNGGAEKIFTFVSPEDKWVYISMTPEDGVNLDLFALSGELPQSDCYKSSTSFDDETEGFWMWAIGNKEYYIVVDGYDEDAGSFTLNVGTCQDPSDGGGNGGGGGDNPPFALDCDDIPELTCGVPLQGTNANGLDVYSSWGDCDGRNNNGREVFYRFDNPVAQQVLIELTNMTENLNVYILNECNPFTCIGDGGTKGRERFDNEDEAVIHPLLAAGEYIIVVDGVENASSNFTLSIDCEDTSFECLQIDLLVNGSNKSNYISSNLLPADRDVASILNPFDDIIQVVSNDRNIAWTPGDPPVLGEWKDLDAFSVLLREEITQDTFIEICGSPVDTAAIKELQGLADQPLPNFIGYPFSYDQPALGIFPDDTGITKLIWQTPDETLFQNPLSTDNAFDLSAGNGYVVMSSEERDLSYRNLDYYNNGCTHFPMQWFGSLQISTVRLGKGFIHALSLKEGDEIAFTTEKGRIVASHIVGNDPFTVVLQGDELDSDTVEGFGIDEIMYFKTWKASTNTEMTYRPVFSNELTNFKVGVHYNIVDVDFINSNTRIDNTSFKVFPNPFSNNIQIVGQFEESDQVQILDVNGQILKQIPTTTGKLLEINIDNSLSAGIYIVKIVKEDSIFIEKIIKQN